MQSYEVIADAAYKQGFTKTALAKQMNMDVELMRRSLNGTRKISADEFVQLCNILKLTLKDFRKPVA